MKTNISYYVLIIIGLMGSSVISEDQAEKNYTKKSSKASVNEHKSIVDSVNDKCFLQPAFFKCDASAKHWIFDSKSLKCKKNIFKCYSNGFSSEKECIRVCGKANWYKHLCMDEVKYQKCDKNMSEWRYDVNNSKCNKVKMGRCLASKLNNFFNQQQCRSICAARTRTTEKASEFCKLPMRVGRCKKSITRYFMNEKGNCRKFKYSGCDGNENNFASRKQCLIVCEKRGLVKKRYFIVRLFDKIKALFVR